MMHCLHNNINYNQDGKSKAHLCIFKFIFINILNQLLFYNRYILYIMITGQQLRN